MLNINRLVYNADAFLGKQKESDFKGQKGLFQKWTTWRKIGNNMHMPLYGNLKVGSTKNPNILELKGKYLSKNQKPI